MFLFLKKLIPIWLLPPGVILLLLAGLLAAGPWLFRRRHRALAYALTGSCFLLLYVASIEPVSRRLMASLENTYPAWDGNARGAACIVVLGGGVLAASPDTAGEPVPTGDAFRRVAHGARLMQKTGLPLVATGGVVFERSGARAEAEVMKEALVRLGADPHRIYTETKSRDTDDNARLTRTLLAKQGLGTNVLLITSAYHMARATLIFRKAGLTPIPVPTDYKTDRGYTGRPRLAEAVLTWMPSASELQRTSLALRERMGLLFYSLSPRGRS